MNKFIPMQESNRPPDMTKEFMGHGLCALEITGPDGLMFEVYVSTLEHELFTPNGEQLREKIEKFFHTLLDT